MPDKTSAPLRAQSAYRQLSNIAVGLNSASDELGKTIAELDVALRDLNLGITSWVRIAGNSDENGAFWNRNIGYARIGGQWGIALQEDSGNESFEDSYRAEEWLFNSAPRWMRVEAIGKIPELLEKLSQQAKETTDKIKKKTEEAKELAAAIRREAAELRAEAEADALNAQEAAKARK
jgi:hypothetical protein